MGWQQLVRRSAFRVAVLYSALFTGSAVAVIGVVYWQTTGALVREVDSAIQAEIEVLAERYRVAGLPGISDLIRERLGRRPAGSGIYLLADAAGRPLVGNLDRWPDVEPGPQGWVEFDLGSAPAVAASVREARGRVFRLEGGYRLLVGRDMLEIHALRQRTLSALGWALAVTIMLALAGAALVGRSAGLRVERMNEAIDEIMSGQLARRLPVTEAGDEMDELAAHVNGMLDRIQQLMEGVKQVSDSIAHDLRTPLARLERRLQEALAPGEAEDDRRLALEQAVQEADALLATFGALLRIARIEAAGQREGFAPVDVSPLLEDVAELYAPVAEDRGVRLRVEPGSGLSVDADRDLLFQALANLVDNALKYAPEDTEVTLRAAALDDRVRMQVSDRGPGIPEADRERVFRRLYRVDASRGTGGSGLGLSLVRAVARLHEGRAWIEDNEPGTRAILELPSRAG